ncbi:MAG: hypothetical protein UY09_C0020G0004 [Parcubacteria group bacterium GW2011_GWA2_47_8]|nr:MAG: hypothetical protein UY09_C0020G0004 [Parcubacteria group bacterium GW2011_GWA2_47_8]
MSKGQSFLLLLLLIMLIILGVVLGRNVYQNALTTAKKEISSVEAIKQTTVTLEGVLDPSNSFNASILQSLRTHGDVPVSQSMGSSALGRSNPFVPYTY